MALQDLQDAAIRRAAEPKTTPAPELTDLERREAMALLTDPRLVDRIIADYKTCGVTGEDSAAELDELLEHERDDDEEAPA